jgi:hypothetical protein
MNMVEIAPDSDPNPQLDSGQAKRYFFQHRQGDTSHIDHEGAEFATLGEAEHEAVRSVREIIASMLMAEGEVEWDGSIEIISDAGDVLRTVTYLNAANVPNIG